MPSPIPDVSFWERIQRCDPRILYALFALVLVLFEFKRPAMPVPVPGSVKMLYDRIENMKQDKIVVIDCALEVAIRAECQGQYESVVRHLFARNIKFAVITWTMFSEGQKLGVASAETIAGEMGKQYGKDYCVLQAMVLAPGASEQAFAKDIPGMVRKDVNGTAVSVIPMMKDVHNISDVALIYRVGYTWDAVGWIGYVQSVYGTPVAVGTAGISSSSAYPYLDAGQLCGVLSGAAGAAAYEHLIGTKGIGSKTVSLQSYATLFVVGAVAVGNIAMVAARRAAKHTVPKKQ